jgi:hypothetical protein
LAGQRLLIEKDYEEKSMKQFRLSVGLFHIEANGRLFSKKTVRSKCGNQVPDKVMQRAIAVMLCLANIFQFIVKCRLVEAVLFFLKSSIK